MSVPEGGGAQVISSGSPSLVVGWAPNMHSRASGNAGDVNAGEVRDEGSIPGLGRSPGGGHGNQFQYSCLENAMDRRAW